MTCMRGRAWDTRAAIERLIGIPLIAAGIALLYAGLQDDTVYTHCLGACLSVPDGYELYLTAPIDNAIGSRHG